MSQDRTVESEVDDMVLTYDEYIKLIDKFYSVQKFSSEVVNVDDILHIANITGNERTDYLNAFKILFKHIHQDGLFYHGNNEDACKYINYILYKEVEVDNKIKRSYDDKPISLFHEFLGAYGEKHGNQNRCISRIRSIKPQTYNRINALYKVYDKYKDIRLFNQDTVQHGCTNFRIFFDSYNEYMFSTKSKSLKFNEILKNIEGYAKKAFSLYSNDSVCNQNSINLQCPGLFKEDTVKKPEIHNPLQKLQTELHSVDSTSQTHLSKDISISQPEQDNERRDEGDSANDIYSTTVDHSANFVHIADARDRGSLHQETKDTYRRTNEEQTQMLSPFQAPFTNFYSTGRSYYSGQQEQVAEQANSKEVELPPQSMMSSITSALKDVDPVPVVGVSGVMGVLFLLFRYTPVGTFFRGRGYRQRIPTRFDGAYPGFFPGFQGFEEGYFPNDQINIAYGRE